MKDLSVRNPNASTRSIVDTGIRNILPDIVSEMPYLKSTKRQVQRLKRKADDRHIAEPKSLSALNPAGFRVFEHNGEELFLAHHQTIDRAGKDIFATVFATRSNLQRLQECAVAGADATFDVLFFENYRVKF